MAKDIFDRLSCGAAAASQNAIEQHAGAPTPISNGRKSAIDNGLRTIWTEGPARENFSLGQGSNAPELNRNNSSRQTAKDIVASKEVGLAALPRCSALASASRTGNDRHGYDAPKREISQEILEAARPMARNKECARQPPRKPEPTLHKINNGNPAREAAARQLRPPEARKGRQFIVALR